jgi:hypothetical protein
VIPKAVFDQLNYSVLTPTPMQLQLADSSVRQPEGIAEDVPVRVRDCFIPVNFVVLDIDNQKVTTLILGWPFLNIEDAHIDVGAGEIRLHINGKEEKSDFLPKKELRLMIRVKFGPNPQKIKEVEVTPSQKDSLITFTKTFIKDDQTKSKKYKKKGNSKVVKTEDPTPVPPTPPKKTKKVRCKKKKTSSPATTSLGTNETTST